MQNSYIKTKLLLIRTLIIILLGLSALTKSQANEATNWQIAESWSDENTLYSRVVKRLIQNVESFSNGSFQIRAIPSNEHKQTNQIFDLVKNGQYEMGHSSSSLWKDRDINSLFFTSLPGGMIAIEQYGWFYHDEGLELMKKAYKKHGLLAFPGGNTGNQMGGWFKKKIESIEDIKGLKIYTEGLASNVYEALGAEVVKIPDDKLYDAFKNNELDALEWIGPSMDLAMNFHELAVYYYTGWHEPSTELQFLVNEQAFAALNPNHQDILVKAMKLAAFDTFVDSYHESAKNLRIMRTVIPNLSPRAFPRNVYRTLVSESENQINKIAEGGDELTQQIIQSRRKYLELARIWTRFSDQAFLNNQF